MLDFLFNGGELSPIIYVVLGAVAVWAHLRKKNRQNTDGTMGDTSDTRFQDMLDDLALELNRLTSNLKDTGFTELVRVLEQVIPITKTMKSTSELKTFKNDIRRLNDTLQDPNQRGTEIGTVVEKELARISADPVQKAKLQETLKKNGVV